MIFDKDKVLTPFTAHEANEGDWGWVSDTIKYMKQKAGGEAHLVRLTADPASHPDKEMPFQYDTHQRCRYFYPAPYEVQQKKWVEKVGLVVGDKVLLTERLNQLKHHDRGFHKTVADVPVGTTLKVTAIREDAIIGYVERVGDLLIGYVQLPYFAIMKHESNYNELQAQWVKENDVKAGDRVYVKRSWEKGEGGFAFVCEVPICQSYTVTKACDDGIEVKKEPTIDPMRGAVSPKYYAVPFFALELVEPKYRKFANAKEFEPHRDRWIREGGDVRYRVLSYDDEYVLVEDIVRDYDELCRDFTFDDTGKPVGVKV